MKGVILMFKTFFNRIKKLKKNDVTVDTSINSLPEINSERIDKLCNMAENLQQAFREQKEEYDAINKLIDEYDMKLIYKDKRTGETHVVDWTDENFDAIMSDENLALVF